MQTEQPTIVLVDDSEVRQAIWVPTLEHEGYRVFSALDGEEALRLSEEEQITAGVSPDMIRLSIGIEEIDDILWDLDQALGRSQD